MRTAADNGASRRRGLALAAVLLAGLACIAGLASPPGADAASGDVEWAESAGGPGNDGIDDSARGPGGTVYTAGQWGPDATSSEFLVRRVQATATGLTHALWSPHYDYAAVGFTDAAEVVAVDRAGALVAAGGSYSTTTADDIIVVKHDPGGDPAWTATYDSGVKGIDRVTGLVTDRTGDVYVSGYSFVSAARTDWTVLKFRGTDGKLLWTYTYQAAPPRTSNFASALAIDRLGAVYVAGSSGSASGSVPVLMKLSPAGSRRWIRSGPAGGVYGEVTVAGTAVYAVGTVTGSGRQRPAVTKYSTAGRRAWTRTWAGPSGATRTRPSDAVVDGRGNLVVVGDAAFGQLQFQAFVAGWSPTGKLRWVRTWPRDAGMRDSRFSGVTADGLGNVWTAGWTRARPNDEDAALMKVSPAGRVLWRRTYGADIRSDDGFTTVSLLGRSSVLAAGRTDFALQDGTETLEVSFVR